MIFAREHQDIRLVTAVNAGSGPQILSLPWDGSAVQDLLSGQRFSVADGQLRLTLPPQSGYLLI